MDSVNPMMMMMNPMMACMMNPMMGMGAMGMGMTPMMGALLQSPPGNTEKAASALGMGMTPMMGALLQSPPGNTDKAASSQSVNRAPGYCKGRGKRAPNAEGYEKPEVDPQVDELCREFGIDERIRNRLNEVMMTREQTFDSDMRELWEVCRTAKRPCGFLMVKIRELEKGIFTGAGKLDRDLAAFQMKHKLDDNSLSKLLEVMQHRQATKHADLRDMEKHLRTANDPSSAVVAMCKQLGKGIALASPPRSKEGRRSKSRSRERRKRSSSRSRSRRR